MNFNAFSRTPLSPASAILETIFISLSLQ
jgi:hypothetical protein